MNIKNQFFIVSILLATLLLSGCVSSPTPSFTSVKDSGPTRPVDVTHVPDAIPKVEPRTIAGNKSPYTVLGKTYTVLPSPDNYRRQGIASWYGRKFHGRKTSNGETYDMYGMTAAHKTIPIPSYVRVTNLKNRKSIIVRVNDRGPFHDDRIIDLSYAAAQKLGFHAIGTAPVEVETIDPVAYHQQRNGSVENAVVSKVPSENYSSQKANVTYLQAGAFSSQDRASNLQNQIAGIINHPVFVRQESAGPIEAAKKLFKVRIGPLSDNLEMLSITEILQLNNLPKPLVVYE